MSFIVPLVHMSCSQSIYASTSLKQIVLCFNSTYAQLVPLASQPTQRLGLKVYFISVPSVHAT